MDRGQVDQWAAQLVLAGLGIEGNEDGQPRGRLGRFDARRRRPDRVDTQRLSSVVGARGVHRTRRVVCTVDSVDVADARKRTTDDVGDGTPPLLRPIALLGPVVLPAFPRRHDSRAGPTQRSDGFVRGSTRRSARRHGSWLHTSTPTRRAWSCAQIRNNVRATDRVESATSSTVRSVAAAIATPTSTTHAGSFSRPRCGTGARYGASVSTSIRSLGVMRAASRTSCAFLNDTMPLKESTAPSASARSASRSPPVKQCTIVRAGVPSSASTANVSSHASRACTTSGSSRSVSYTHLTLPTIYSV